MQTSGSLSSPLIDERLNQLDEFQSHSDVAQSRGSAPQSQSVLAGLTQVVHEACEVLEVSDDPADSVPSSAESAPVHDVRMAEPSGAQKQVVSEIAFSDVEKSSRGRSQFCGWKALHRPGLHVPPGVLSAALLACLRSSLGSRSSSRK